MALTRSEIEARLDAFFTTIKSNIVSSVSDKEIPLLGKLGDLPGGAALDPFAALKDQILAAVESASDTDVAASVASAINGLNIEGLEATATASGGIDLSILKAVKITSDTVALSTGDTLGSLLNLSATGSASFEAALNAKVSFDSAGAFSLDDLGAPELTVGVDANFSLQNLQADLGLAKIKVVDASTSTPEFSADFGFDLSLDGGTFDVTPTLTGKAALDLDFETTFLAGLLPKIKGELVVDFATNGIEFGAPTITLNNLTLSLKDYLGIVGETLGDVAKIFNHGALGTIVDIATEPVPALDDLAQAFPYLYGIFDKVGSVSGGGDEVITIGDLAAFANPTLAEPLANFYRAIAIISELRKFGATNDAGEISFGGGSLLGGTKTSNIDVDSIIDQLGSEIDGFSELSSIAKDLLKTVDSALPPTSKSTGFTFGLLENPETILDIFFQKSKPVDLIEFDVPALSFEVAAGGFFPVLGPLGFVLKGKLGAGIDVDIGYDTAGLATGKFLDGFYFTTAADDPNVNGPSRINKSTGVVFPYEPVGWLDTTITGGAGINFVAGEAGVAADFGFNVDAYFKEEKFRPTSADFGCAFDISGRAYVDVHLYIQVGFGPFSIEKNISLASATLADFNSFKCPPPTVEPTPLEPGLATAVASDLLLNVGDRAQFRIIKDNGGSGVKVANPDDPLTPTIDESQVEGYVIALARDPGGDDINPRDNPPPTLVPGQLDITAFGFTQRAATPGIIRADFKDGNDLLVIQSDVLVDSDISGGGGNDTLTGGGGRDTLRGDAGADALTGGNGDDVLRGGADNDTLDGGKGGDVLDGGDGIDTVDYSRSNRDVKVGVFVTLADTSYFGSGGDAEGDTFISVENVVGTDFDDYIQATGASFKTFLEGGRGNDVLIGGKNGDLLLGGEGADTLSGQDGEDGTSYVTSWGRVDIDLQRAVQIGGDAQGDRLYSVEDVQGSINNDSLRGDFRNNLLDGSNGDDVLEGRGGQDTILGGLGDDLIYGGADGDTLDGGPGFDTLSYEKAAGPVTVDLGHSQERVGGTVVFAGPSTDKIVMAVPAPSPTGRGYSSFNNLIGSNNATGDGLTGDLAANRIEGLAGNDFINGDGGNDVLIGGAGADVIIGGEGSDWTYYDDSASGVVVDLLGTGIGGTAQGDTYDLGGLFGSTVENVLGSRYGDTLRGNGLDNILDPNISGRQVTEFVDGRGNPLSGAGDILRVDYSTWEADRGQGVFGGFASGSQSDGGLTRLTSTGAATLDQVGFTNIERLFVTGTSKADTIYGGQLADRIYTGSGNDVVIAGRGADDVHTEGGDDTVAWGTSTTRSLDFGGAAASSPASFHLDGGRGLDTLSIDLSFTGQNLSLAGRSTATEFTGINVRLSNAAAAENFEYLGDVRTGRGDDSITQLGNHNNRFDTGAGEDIITPGLGFDRVDGGLDLVGAEAGYGISNAFADAKGDRLVLDYASLGPEQSVRGSSALDGVGIFVAGNPLYTNYGSYSSAVTRDSEVRTSRVFFDGIEGLTVTGSRGDDVLGGTNTVYRDLSYRGVSDNRGGDDILSGGDGDDVIIGLTGDDILDGGAGDDILQGAANNIRVGGDVAGYGGFHFDDLFEVDRLTGGDGADQFILGDGLGSFYNDFGNTTFSTSNRAIITDFDASEGDIVVLHSGSEYTVKIDGSTARLYINDGAGGAYGDVDELIAEFENAPDFDLAADYVTYFGAGRRAVPGASDPQNLAARLAVEVPAAPQKQVAPAAGPAALAISAAATDWVDQTTDLDVVKAKLEGAGAPAGSTLTLEGSAEAFGTFADDPFGLGSGIILSTGRVEDLPGVNTASGPSSLVGSIALDFVRIGQTSGTTIYRADLSGLGIDIRSLLIEDSGSGLGGSPGRFSGFDLDAIVLSRKLVSSVPSAAVLNDGTFLPQLDVFDFSNAGVVLKPGSQRPGGNAAPDLNGQVNGLLDGLATLSTFDSSGSVADVGRAMTLGDSGSIGFDLTETVSTKQPLYLYISEAGISMEETVRGFVSASSNTLEPIGDLSTDLGPSGPDGDTTRLTYTFTPKAGDTAFSFDAVFFSEELPEYDGTALTDLFTIKLNGVDIGALSNGAALTIKNLVYAGSGDLIANLPGTGPLADTIKADAYTRTLTISGAVDPGTANTLTIELKDGRDAFLDSGLLIKEGSFKTYVAPPFVANTPPQITPPAGEILVPENTTAVTTVVATDPDPGQALTYSIFGGADAAAFKIDPTTGVLAFKTAPDFESPTDQGGNNVYDVIVKAQDSSASPLFALQDVHVRVTDLDETNRTYLDFDLAKTAVDPGEPRSTWQNPLTNLDYTQGTYSASSSAADDRTGSALARFRQVDGDVAVQKVQFAGASAVDPAGSAPALTLDWTGSTAVLKLETAWNSIKSIELKAFTGESLKVVKFVDVEADWSAVTSDVDLTLDGAKRSDIVLGSGDDTLTILADSNGPGFSNVHRVSAGDGNDTVTLGVSTIDYAKETFGTSYDPTVTMAEFNGGRGDDTLVGGFGADLLNGGADNDTLTGGAGADTFVFEAGTGHDVVTDFAAGSAGTDIVKLTGFSFASFAQVQAAMTQIGADTRLVLSGDSHVTFLNHSIGDFAADDFGFVTPPAPIVLPAAPPASAKPVSYIYGDVGNDTLEGDQYANYFNGKAGQDKASGGFGDDTYNVEGQGDTVIELPGQGTDTIESWGSYALTAGVENLKLLGIGLTGVGNELANAIIGGKGNDRLNGKAGDDYLTGGAGADTFVFEPGMGHDVITDFAAGGAGTDIVDLQAFNYASFDQIKSGMVQVGQTVQLKLSDTSYISFLNTNIGQFEANDFVL